MSYPPHLVVISERASHARGPHPVHVLAGQGQRCGYIQRGKDGNAKAYQVRQVVDAIARLEAEKNEESDDDA
jgi:hypothetical protein